MRYVTRRLAFYLVAFWAAITLNFLVPRLMPGDPASTLFAQMQGRMTTQQLIAMKRAFGLGQGNILQQYLTYMNNLAHGNLSLSFSHYPTPVATVIAQDLRWTLLLVGVSLVISFVVGTALGIVCAWHRGSILDRFLPPVLMVAWAFPPFWVGLVVLYLLGLEAGWFPLAHAYDLNLAVSLTPQFVASVIQHALLPSFVLILTTIGSWLLGMRNMMIATLAEDFITLAKARGLGAWRIMFTYAARNAILPQITAFAIALGFVISGQVFIELVFSYPGVGFDLVQAAQSQDYPLLQGLLLFFVIAVLFANLIMDFVLVRLDPRVRQER